MVECDNKMCDIVYLVVQWWFWIIRRYGEPRVRETERWTCARRCFVVCEPYLFFFLFGCTITVII